MSINWQTGCFWSLFVRLLRNGRALVVSHVRRNKNYCGRQNWGRLWQLRFWRRSLKVPFVSSGRSKPSLKSGKPRVLSKCWRFDVNLVEILAPKLRRRHFSGSPGSGGPKDGLRDSGHLPVAPQQARSVADSTSQYHLRVSYLMIWNPTLIISPQHAAYRIPSLNDCIAVLFWLLANFWSYCYMPGIRCCLFRSVVSHGVSELSSIVQYNSMRMLHLVFSFYHIVVWLARN